MKAKTAATSAAAMLGLVLGGATSSAAQAQEQERDVAECIRGEWESTGISIEHPQMADLEVSGGDGIMVDIAENGAVTADFTSMDPATFTRGESGDTTVRGHLELRGEATGTLATNETDEDSGNLDILELNSEDVELTVVLTEPFDSRPIDRVPLDELRQLTEKHAEPMRAQSTYECGAGTLTITHSAEQEHESSDNGYAELVMTFERTQE